MPIRRVSPAEAAEMMEKEGYVYLDVRSIPEFEDGHPTGAFNIPLLHLGPMGMEPNPDFVAVFEATFEKDAKIVIGCRSGGRSMRACQMLIPMGYPNLVDNKAGFEAGSGEPGWGRAGLPTSTEAQPGRDYESLSQKK